MTIALLAGTAEARAVARALAAAGIPARASLAGVTRAPEPLPIPTRRGGFGGADAYRGWLRAEGIGAVLDATHPFAASMAHRAARASAALGLPHRRLLRPGWEAGPGDRWTRIARAEDAADAIPPGSRVLLATGPGSLGGFAALDAHLICRRIDPATGPFPLRGEWLVGRPPFDLASEVDLMRRSRVDWLVVKDSGGAAGRAKLDAARALGLPVAIIDRPAQPRCGRVRSPEEAMAWIRALPRG